MTLNIQSLQKDQEAAQRISDTVRLHILAHKDIEEIVGQWCVFRLDDATTDNVLYDCKADAVKAMKGRSKDYCYLVITPDGISPSDAYRYLLINRNPMIDTTAPEHVINPALYPRMSNLTPQQRQTAKRLAIEEWKRAH